MKLQQPLTALLLAFAATISAVSVGAQDEVKQDVISDRDFIEVYTEGEFEDERSQKSQEAEQPVLNAVNFDEFSAVAEEEVPTPPPATEIVGGVKYDSEGMIILGEGQTYELKTGKEFQKFQTDNEIIKAENDSMHKIFVTGKALGTANLHIYFTDGSSQSHSFRVKSDSDSFTSIIKQLFPTHKLEIVPIRDTAVFLRGTVETEAEVQQIEEIAGEFWPTVHNHIQAMQPEMQAVYSDKKSEGIPNGMRVITVPVVDWVQNQNGLQFNKIVSLYSTEIGLSSLHTNGVFTGKEKLIAHNLMVFAHRGMKRSKDGFNVSLLVKPEQVGPIKQVNHQGGKLLLVSQVVNLKTQNNDPSGNSLTGSPTPDFHPPTYPGVPHSSTQTSTQMFPLYDPEKSVSQPEYKPDPIPHQDQLIPADDFSPNSPSDRDPRSLPPVGAISDLSTPIGQPGPAHVPFGGPPVSQQEPSTSPFPPFSSNEDKAATSLQGDVQALHTDVKKLIELLEKRQAMKEKQATTEAQNEVVPQNGKTVLFFHADWGGPSQIMKSIVKKLHEDGISIVSVDIDEHPELMRRYKVDSIPTLLHIENGHPYPDSKKTGLMTEEGLRNYVRDYDPPIQMVEQSFSYSDFLTKNLVQISISEPVATNSDSLNSSPADNLGTGMIIHHSGKKLCVLTAAHLFRKPSKDREVTVKFFHRKDGIYEPHYCQGKLISSDEDADLALVEFEIPNITYSHKPTHLSTKLIEAGDEVKFVGFSTQDRISRFQLTGKVASVDRFAGPANFQIADVIATHGMSGSPVFDKDERLCGIVIAADGNEKQTVCTGLQEIKKLLKEAKIELPEQDPETIPLTKTEADSTSSFQIEVTR